jgi:hypothetical protein
LLYGIDLRFVDVPSVEGVECQDLLGHKQIVMTHDRSCLRCDGGPCDRLMCMANMDC